MIDDGAEGKTDALELVGEITRRAGHEIRNALSGVAVNVEVVKSRAARGDGADALAPFADRAALQVGVATALTNGLLGFVGSVLAAQAEGNLRALPTVLAGSRMGLNVYGDGASVILSDIKHLANHIGVAVEEDAERVILTVSPEGTSHPKN